MRRRIFCAKIAVSYKVQLFEKKKKINDSENVPPSVRPLFLHNDGPRLQTDVSDIIITGFNSDTDHNMRGSSYSHYDLIQLSVNLV